MNDLSDALANPNKWEIFQSNRLGRVILLALEEVLGSQGVTIVLNTTGLLPEKGGQSTDQKRQKLPFKEINCLETILESTYGARAGRGLALRVGRVCLKYGLREFGNELGLTGLDFRLLPVQKKIKAGIEAFATLFNDYSDQKVRLEREGKFTVWNMDECQLCREIPAGSSCSNFEVGFLQEILYWASGGKYFEVANQCCIVDGDRVCKISIDRTPMS